MNYQNNNTGSRKNKHLDFKERITIKIWLKDEFLVYKIAKELGISINTVLNYTVIGEKSNNDNVLLTILEHKTRYAIILDIVTKTAYVVTDALSRVHNLYWEQFNQVLKIITGDNSQSLLIQKQI